MRFFVPASLLTLSSGALAAIRPVQFFASSDNEEVNGQGLYSTHEGAGINYFFLGAGQTLQYNDEARVVYVELNSQPPARQYLAFTGNVLSLTVAEEPLPVDIGEDGSVTFPESDALAAAKNINDPYRYSESVFAVVKDGGEGSFPLTLSAKFGDAEEEQQPTSSEEASEPTDVAYSNKTVTVFTTYCPEPTTLTLTVCETVCEQTEVTVSEAGNVTVENVKTEEATEAPAEEESTSVAAPAVTEEPEVTSYEGSAATVGGAGLAAIAFAAAGLVF
ncbi:Pga30 GPI-anchored protein of cell wall [Candida orthopsilosis Co 90-125]|uniref:Pga30 GPI-anchored protein of cell wall n=1 Tax=Candida orthopsilosis (strain 90-125) TaxID=1136231 RepID=H8X7K8_CANO9|nr:Pga30 GPI-anchored protein of cell wall [Candida orthopsilosis Co 90-125]CCG23792.1 Pga30 GPI-anchored protein of cell wall [Candida orthopsilosis Co 90-125]